MSPLLSFNVGLALGLGMGITGALLWADAWVRRHR